MPHASALFLLFQSLEYLTGASWSRAVPHRFSLPCKEDPAHCSGLTQEWPLRGWIGWTSRSPERTQPLGNHLMGPAAPEHRRLLCTWPPSPALSSGSFSRGCCSQWYGVLSASAVRSTEVLRCVGNLHSPLSTLWKIGSGNHMAKWSDQIASYAFLWCSTRLEATTFATTPVSSQPC